MVLKQCMANKEKLHSIEPQHDRVLLQALEKMASGIAELEEFLKIKKATKKATAAAEAAPEDPLPNVDGFSSEDELGDYSSSDLDSSNRTGSHTGEASAALRSLPGRAARERRRLPKNHSGAGVCR